MPQFTLRSLLLLQAAIAWTTYRCMRIPVLDYNGEFITCIGVEFLFSLPVWAVIAGSFSYDYTNRMGVAIRIVFVVLGLGIVVIILNYPQWFTVPRFG